MNTSTSIDPDRRHRTQCASRSTTQLHLFVAAAMIPFLAGCDTEAPTDLEPVAASAATHSAETGQAEMRMGLATLRRATARYHRVEAALADGFQQVLPCQSNPDGAGALGIPFLNLARLDAIIDLSEPEVLFYEPQQNGRLQLVGAEPVVPIAAWPESEPPSLFGQEFHRNEAAGLFGLHMWVWRHSPDGIFSFWNVNVSCEFAE